MRLHFLFALFIGATLSTCAQAQPVDEPRRDEAVAAVWEQTPSTTDFERAFPVQARRFNVSGRVVLDCRVDGQGRLVQCAVVDETPLGMGFGAAALEVSSLFRMAPAARNQLSSDRFRLPLSFETEE